MDFDTLDVLDVLHEKVDHFSLLPASDLNSWIADRGKEYRVLGWHLQIKKKSEVSRGHKAKDKGVYIRIEELLCEIAPPCLQLPHNQSGSHELFHVVTLWNVTNIVV